MSSNLGKDGVTTNGLFDKRLALTATEVADALGIKRGALYVMVHRKTIPFHKRGKRLVFIPDEIRAWLTKGATHVS